MKRLAIPQLPKVCTNMQLFPLMESSILYLVVFEFDCLVQIGLRHWGKDPNKKDVLLGILHI